MDRKNRAAHCNSRCKESKSRIRHSLIGPGKCAATMLHRRYAVHRSLPIK
jgi:hypothetical protein